MDVPAQIPLIVMPTQEGVIKYQLDFKRVKLDDSLPTADIQRCFARCRAAHLIGQNPALYEGYAYGNISQRVDQGFLISATQTGGFDALRAEDISWVFDFSLKANRLSARGLFAPSSEAMTHGHIYQLRPNCRFVIHVHSSVLWQKASALGMPMTDPAAEYGTPAMAREVERLLNFELLADSGIFSMGGHEDGLVAFANNMKSAEAILFDALNEAVEMSK